MIKALVAVDDKLGIANDAGIPWNVPTDREHVHRTIGTEPVLMGFRTYQERKGPRTKGKSFVIVRPGTTLKDGFIPVSDVKTFLQAYESDKDIWVMGGAAVYKDLLPYIGEIHITRVAGDFNCTKFFPAFEDSFTLQEKQTELEENGVRFHFERWHQNS